MIRGMLLALMLSVGVWTGASAQERQLSGEQRRAALVGIFDRLVDGQVDSAAVLLMTHGDVGGAVRGYLQKFVDVYGNQGYQVIDVIPATDGQFVVHIEQKDSRLRQSVLVVTEPGSARITAILFPAARPRVD